LTDGNGFALLWLSIAIVYVLLRHSRSASASVMPRTGAAAGLGADILVAIGTKRAPFDLIAKVAGAAALLVAFTATVYAQSGSDFLNNIDPLFSGVLARPGNLDNTIQYGVSAAARGDIESAISTYEQLRF
jgi:hypothetical protein